MSGGDMDEPGSRLVADWLAEALGGGEAHEQGEPAVMRLIGTREPAGGLQAPAYVVVTDGPVEEVRPGDMVQVGTVPVGGGIVWEAGTVAEVDGDRGEQAAAAWDCGAYGAGGKKVGAVCFASPELGERECRTEGECAELLAGERVRVFEAMREMAVAGDPTGRYLAARITSPDQILGGGEPADHAFVPGGDDSAFGDAGTWCAVWLPTGTGEPDQCGMPADVHGPDGARA